MNNSNTLRIYEHKTKRGKVPYRYFFIKKDLQHLFDNLGIFTLTCSDGTNYKNLEVCVSGKNQSFFIFANDFFIEHPKLSKDEEVEFYVDMKKRIVFIQIQPSALEKELEASEVYHSQIDGELLEKTIDNIKDSFKKYEWYYRSYEANVRADLVDPILKTIGWAPPYIHREEDGMDYLLYGDEYFNTKSPKMVIEVKKYCEQLRSTGGGKTPIKYDNEQDQIIEYCKRENVQAKVGLLTNGIRWCLYLENSNNEYQYSGEINIVYSYSKSIYRFFNLLSRAEFENTSQLDWDWLKKSKIGENRPHTISINGKPYPSQKEAVITIATMFINKCYDSGKDPYSYRFSETIFTNNMIHISDYPNIDKRGRFNYIHTYRDIYEQIILLQEINSRFDLGLTIESY